MEPNRRSGAGRVLRKLSSRLYLFARSESSDTLHGVMTQHRPATSVWGAGGGCGGVVGSKGRGGEVG